MSQYDTYPRFLNDFELTKAINSARVFIQNIDNALPNERWAYDAAWNSYWILMDEALRRKMDVTATV